MSSRASLVLLVLCQALLLTNNVVNIGMNGLAGYALAEHKALATLPLTAYVVGTALATIPMSLWMKRVGRRWGFVTGSLFGLCGAGICALAVIENSFWLLAAGTFVTGAYNAAGQFYRFAAAELVDEAWRSRAIGLVLAGGIGGAILGPEGSKYAKDALALPFLGAYALLAACALGAMLLQLFLRAPLPVEYRGEHSGARPLMEIARQPRFVVAVAAAFAGFAMMTLMMTSTPLAMVACQHSYSATSFVIEGHAVAMFAPSFFTGSLIRRFGITSIVSAGAALMLGAAAVALAGTTVAHFWLALVLLGAGWNFLYVGGTTLLTTVHRPSERAKVQGFNDMLVFAGSGIASLMSGVLLQTVGWNGLVLGMIVPLLAIPAVLVWGMRAAPRTEAA